METKKTTIELPVQLMRRARIKAIQEGRTLKDFITESIERNISESSNKPALPKPLRLRGGYMPDTNDIERAIAEGRKH